MTWSNISIRLMLITCCVSAAGCQSTHVRKAGSSNGPKSKFAPVNESSRGGVVKYLNNGADFVIEARREDAYRTMYKACEGSYKIDAEGPREEGGVVAPMQGGAGMWAGFQYWYIQYSCVPTTAGK